MWHEKGKTGFVNSQRFAKKEGGYDLQKLIQSKNTWFQFSEE